MLFDKHALYFTDEVSFFLILDITRNLVCVDNRCELRLAKHSSRKYLKKQFLSPCLLCLPFSPGLRTEEPNYSLAYNGLMLYLKDLPGITGKINDGNLHLLKHVSLVFHKTPYRRLGFEVAIQDSFARHLASESIPPDHSHLASSAQCLDFFESRLPGEHSKFYLMPFNINCVSATLLERCLCELKLRCKPIALPVADLLLREEYLKTANPFNLESFLRLYRPALRTWLPAFAKRFRSKRKSLLVTRLGPKYDYLGISRESFNGFCKGIAPLSDFLQRARQLPSSGPCILATARNEAIYLPDWCAYHLALGFAHIYLYTNDNDDKTLEVATRLAQLCGRITVINNVVKSKLCRPQFKAYRHALTYFSDLMAHSWCAVIDIDEYIALKSSLGNVVSIQSYLNKITKKALMPPDIVALNWIFAGVDRSDPYSGDVPVTLAKRIDHSIGPNRHIKSIFRPQFFLASACHNPIPNPHRIPFPVNSSGDMYSSLFTATEPALSPSVRVREAAVMHYWHKSPVEFIFKASRNRGDHPVNSTFLPDLERLESFSRQFYSSSESRTRANDWIQAVMLSDKYLALAESFAMDTCMADLLGESWHLMCCSARDTAQAVLAGKDDISPRLKNILEDIEARVPSPIVSV